MKFWGIEQYYDHGRVIPIYEAIKDLPIKSVLEIACGQGLVTEALSWALPATYSQFDIESYPEWEHLRARPFVADVMDFIKEDQKFDLVIFLNSYRNWERPEKKEFDEWLQRNATYFITSNELAGDGEEIGNDCKGYKLKLYKL